MRVICSICNIEDDGEKFEIYQTKNIIYHNCCDTVACKLRQVEYEGLKEFGVKIEDLEYIPHDCCMRRSYYCPKNNKYYIRTTKTMWIESDELIIQKNNYDIRSSYLEFGISVDDLTLTSKEGVFFCELLNKYYIEIKISDWKEIDARDIQKEQYFP